MKLTETVNSFRKSLGVLQKADYQKARDEIYRSGIIAEFARTFELAWKSMQALLETDPGTELMRGSPRNVIRAAYAAGVLSESDVWLQMLEDRNSAFYRYEEEIADALLDRVQLAYVPAFENLLTALDEEIGRSSVSGR